MKKSILIAIAILAFGFPANAQEKKEESKRLDEERQQDRQQREQQRKRNTWDIS